MTAAVVSSLATVVHGVLSASAIASLGASGAVMGLVGAICGAYPNAHVHLFFMPALEVQAKHALAGIILLDAVGLLRGWSFFAHAAHLGGALFGVWYAQWGKHLLWGNRAKLVKEWRNVRDKWRG